MNWTYGELGQILVSSGLEAIIEYNGLRGQH